MTVTRIALLALTLAIVPATLQAQEASSRLTLEEAINLALANNRTLAAATLQNDKAVADLADAKSHRLPQFSIDAQAAQLLRPIDVHFNQGVFGEFAGIGPVPATDTTITTPTGISFLVNAQAAQPLTQLKRINLGVRMSEAAQALERETLRGTRLTIVSEVKRLYYGILQSESALDASTHSIALLREVERVTTDRVAQRVALRTDALDVRTRLANAELARLTIDHTLRSQKEQLNVLLGRDVRTAFDTAPAAAVTRDEVDLTAAQSRALDMRPDVQQARVRLEQAEIGHRIARTESIPDVSLAASYFTPLNVDGAPRSIVSASLQLSWEPFDWGRRGRKVATRALEIQQASHRLRETEDKAIVELNASFRRIDEARARLRVAALAQDSAREAARVRTSQFRVNAALLQDVLHAESASADADNQYQQALLAFWMARADFERALGQEGIQ